MPREHIHFVTGRLAEFSLRRVLETLAPAVGFDYSIEVLGITVAALMTPEWISRRMRVPAAATRVLLPGYCNGDLAPLAAAAFRAEAARHPSAWFAAGFLQAHLAVTARRAGKALVKAMAHKRFWIE